MPRNEKYFLLPKKLHTSYCGIPISNYGLEVFGRENISIIIDHVKFCEHGQECTECCFNYVGPIQNNKLGQTSHIESMCFLPQRLTRYVIKRPLKFLYESTIGYAKHIFLHSCKNYRCVNFAHVIVKQRVTKNSILSLIKKCEHGSQCVECCWMWRGPTYKQRKRNKTTQRPNILAYDAKGHRVLYNITNYLARNILNIDVAGSYTFHTCGNYMCGNWNHIQVKPLSYGTVKMLRARGIERN